MEQWSVRDDRPYFREPRTYSGYLWIGFFVVLAAAAGTAAYFLWPRLEVLGLPQLGSAEPKIEAPAPAAAAPSAEVAPTAEQAVAEPAKPLPTLENSDPLMRETVSGLVGRKAFEAMVYPSQLIRRIVATVDNLPRETAPRRVMPLEPVPGGFAVAATGDEATITAANSARYAPYVRVFETIDSRALARRYFESYPLFQRAYAELGFPGQRFHDRLLEAIDDMLDAPELTGPVKLIRPKVLYKFADPELESLSAGQKIMIRIGVENGARVKAKLREIRRELSARQIR